MEYRTVYADLPTTIPGFAKYDPVADFVTIVLNAKLSDAKNRETYLHEVLGHIRKGDFSRNGNVDTIELSAHERELK